MSLNFNFWEGSELQTKWGHGCQSESASPLSPGHMCRTDLASSRAARLASGKDLASLRELLLSSFYCSFYSDATVHN